MRAVRIMVVGSRTVRSYVRRGENIFAGARFIFPARPNSGYFRSLQFLRLFRMTWSTELVGKILDLRRSQYEFILKISVKVFTSYSLSGYEGHCRNCWYWTIRSDKNVR